MSHCLLGINFGERLRAFKIGYATPSFPPFTASLLFVYIHYRQTSEVQRFNEITLEEMTCWTCLRWQNVDSDETVIELLRPVTRVMVEALMKSVSALVEVTLDAI